MKKTPRISATEWAIMREVWTARQPVTAAAIIAALNARESGWHPKTARTLIARLVRKKALGQSRQGRGCVFSARATEADCVAAATASFLERVFDGSAVRFLVHLAGNRRISAPELEEFLAHPVIAKLDQKV